MKQLPLILIFNVIVFLKFKILQIFQLVILFEKFQVLLFVEDFITFDRFYIKIAIAMKDRQI